VPPPNFLYLPCAREAEDGFAACEEFFFEAGGGKRWLRDFFEHRKTLQCSEDLCGIALLIGEDPEEAAFPECAGAIGEESGIHKASCGVTAFRPGVGEENVDGGRGGGRKATRGMHSFGAYNMGVGECASLDFLQGACDAFLLPFDAEEVGAGIAGCHGDEEFSAVASEIDHERR